MKLRKFRNKCMKVTTPQELVSDKRKQTRHISREDKAK